MITLTSSLSGKYFSCTVPDIEFSINGYRALVTLTVDRTSIYSEYLYPVGGSITMSEVGNLLAPYAKQSLVVALTVSITEQYESGTENTSSMSATIIYCEADFGTTADYFTSNYFLSTFMGDRTTAAGRLEYLHYIGTDAATVTANYADGSTAEFSLTASGGNDDYTTIDVSPDQFVTEGKTLVSYTVTAGSRGQKYVMDLDEPDCAPILIFVNSFGVEELIYCTGSHTVAPSYERNTMRQAGVLKNYEIKETRTFKADTGVLSFPAANWLDELFRSDYVRVVNIYNGVPTIGKEVIITESKSEYTNDYDTLPRFTFSYQYAQRNQNVIDLNRAGRIFDNTFDHTFE